MALGDNTPSGKFDYGLTYGLGEDLKTLKQKLKGAPEAIDNAIVNVGERMFGNNNQTTADPNQTNQGGQGNQGLQNNNLSGSTAPQNLGNSVQFQPGVNLTLPNNDNSTLPALGSISDAYVNQATSSFDESNTNTVTGKNPITDTRPQSTLSIMGDGKATGPSIMEQLQNMYLLHDMQMAREGDRQYFSPDGKALPTAADKAMDRIKTTLGYNAEVDKNNTAQLANLADANYKNQQLLLDQSKNAREQAIAADEYGTPGSPGLKERQLAIDKEKLIQDQNIKKQGERTAILNKLGEMMDISKGIDPVKYAGLYKAMLTNLGGSKEAGESLYQELFNNTTTR